MGIVRTNIDQDERVRILLGKLCMSNIAKDRAREICDELTTYMRGMKLDEITEIAGCRATSRITDDYKHELCVVVPKKYVEGANDDTMIIFSAVENILMTFNGSFTNE